MSEEQKQQSSGDQSPNIITDSGDVNITYQSTGKAALSAIPDYFSELFSLLARPRVFLREASAQEGRLFAGGLVFLCLSCMLGFLLRATGTGGDIGLALTATVFYLLTGLCLALVAYGACRVLGGSGSLKGHVGTFCYIAGISAILFPLVSLAAQLVILVGLEEHFALYQEYMRLLLEGDEEYKQERFFPVSRSLQLKLSMAVLLGGGALIFAWLMAAWRAFGNLNGFSGSRVSMSLVLFLVVGYWVSQGLALLQDRVGVALF